jgi:hypothetical protein
LLAGRLLQAETEPFSLRLRNWSMAGAISVRILADLAIASGVAVNTALRRGEPVALESHLGQGRLVRGTQKLASIRRRGA